MKYNIKKLNIEDALKYKKAIFDILNNVFLLNIDNYNSDIIDEKYNNLIDYLTNNKAIVFSAYDKEQLCGLIWGFMPEPQKFHIAYYGVDSQHQKKGIGKLLLDTMENYCKLNNINEMELLVTSTNSNAVQFYLNQQFQCKRMIMSKKINNEE